MEKIRELFGVDLRSLALFRICLGCLLIADLMIRSMDMTAFYTDAGVLPLLSDRPFYSILHTPHLWSGSFYYQSFLFILAGLIAFSVIIGFYTRTATFLSWALLLSLFDRNPNILSGSDALIKIMLFWSFFLPLGSYFAVDRALNKSKPLPFPQYCSSGTAAFLLQICLIYWAAAGYKWNEDWLSGKAVAMVLNIEQFTTPFGIWLGQQTAFLSTLTYLTLYTEMLGPFFAFTPFYNGIFRTVTVFAFILMHTMFGMALTLGLFSFTCFVSWIIFLPGFFWDSILPHFRFGSKQPFKLYYNPSDSTTAKGLSFIQTFLLASKEQCYPMEQDSLLIGGKKWFVIDEAGKELGGADAVVFLWKKSSIFWPLGWLLSFPPFFWIVKKICNFFSDRNILDHFKWHKMPWWPTKTENIIIFILMLYNIYLTAYIHPITAPYRNPTFDKYSIVLGQVMSVEQTWNMFSTIMRNNGWLVIEGTLQNGEKVDLFRNGQPIDWKKPPLVSDLFINERWRKYFEHLAWESNPELAKQYSTYLRKEWDSTHDEAHKLTTIKGYLMLEKTNEDLSISPVTPTLIWQNGEDSEVGPQCNQAFSLSM